MGESTRQREAFDYYWQLGADRSIERLHSEMVERKGKAPSLRTLYDWSSRYGWQARIARLEHEARVAEDDARIAAIREMHQRQARAGLFLQQKGMEWLVAMDTEVGSHEAAIRAIVEGSKLERLVRGEATERKEVTGELSTRLSDFSDDELDAFIGYAAGLLDRAREAPSG